MSARHVLEELSAYIDGECPDPQRVARHLQSCPDCARRHLELLKLSTVLAGMDGPEVGPLFAARVLARIEATDAVPARPFPWLPRPALALGLAATFAVALAGIVFTLGKDHQRAPSSSPVAAVNEAWMDDEQVVSALGELNDSDLWEDPFGRNDGGGDSEPVPSLDELLDGLAAGAIGDDDMAWYEQEDLITVLDALAQEDARVLRELAENHWDKG